VYATLPACRPTASSSTCRERLRRGSRRRRAKPGSPPRRSRRTASWSSTSARRTWPTTRRASTSSRPIRMKTSPRPRGARGCRASGSRLPSRPLQRLRERVTDDRDDAGESRRPGGRHLPRRRSMKRSTLAATVLAVLATLTVYGTAALPHPEASTLPPNWHIHHGMTGRRRKGIPTPGAAGRTASARGDVPDVVQDHPPADGSGWDCWARRLELDHVGERARLGHVLPGYRSLSRSSFLKSRCCGGL